MAEEEGDANLGASKMERRLSLMKSFDHRRWLYESKGTYGYGNAVWGEEDTKGDVEGKTWKPLTRKVKVPAAILSPYRSVSLFFFLFPFTLQKKDDADDDNECTGCWWHYA